MPRPPSRGTPANRWPTPRPEIRGRTLRIRDIPLSVKQEDFKDFLKQLLGYDDFILSYVYCEYMITATVTLTNGEPLALSTCTPGKTIYLACPLATELKVDCDFLGMTPLYSAENPTVE